MIIIFFSFEEIWSISSIAFNSLLVAMQKQPIPNSTASDRNKSNCKRKQLLLLLFKKNQIIITNIYSTIITQPKIIIIKYFIEMSFLFNIKRVREREIEKNSEKRWTFSLFYSHPLIICLQILLFFFLIHTNVIDIYYLLISYLVILNYSTYIFLY